MRSCRRVKSPIDSTEYGQLACRGLGLLHRDPEPPRIRVLDDFGRLLLGGGLC